MTASATPRATAACRKGEVIVDRRFAIPYRIYGDDGPLLVCINGIVQSMSVWKPVVDVMRDSHRVLVFDFPGQGRARILDGVPRLDLDDQVRIIDSLLLEIGETRPVRILSASFGAVIACLFAQSRPRRVSRLLLCSFSIRPGESLRRVQSQLLRLIDAGRAADVAEVIVDAAGGRLPEPLVRSIRRQFANIGDEQLALFRHHLRWLLAFEARRDNPFRFAGIRAKTRILAGAEDPVLNRADLAGVARQVPDCEVTYLPGCGHFMHLEQGKSDLVWHYRDFLVGESSPARPRARWTAAGRLGPQPA